MPPCVVLLDVQAHHVSKHDKLPWDPTLYEDVQAKYGATTQGVAVRGTTNAKKLKVRAAAGTTLIRLCRMLRNSFKSMCETDSGLRLTSLFWNE